MPFFNKNCQKKFFLNPFKLLFNQKGSFFAILGIFLISQNLFAEGTKQLSPTADDRVYIQPSPNGFAYYNGPEDLRMKIHIANPEQEQVFLGFSRPATSSVYPCSGSLTDAYFRIKDADGNVVFPTPGSNDGQILNNGSSNISTYTQAVAGPSPIAGGSGYTPFVFNPDGLPAGDYYIEFSSSMDSPGSSTVNIELFDITVATEGGSPTAIDGRLNSKIWSMYAPRIECNCDDPTYGCFDRPFNGKFYVYTPTDSVVIEVDFKGSGMQPAFFNVFFNSYGTTNSGNVNLDRKSLNSQQVFATEYPIFLNNPDPNVYPSGIFGTYAEEPFFHTCNGASGSNGAAVEFIASVTKAGQLEVLIDLENPGDFLFTPNSKDVTIAVKVDPQPSEVGPYLGVIEWDGLDGLGNPVDFTQNLTYRIKYSQAIVHFPIYDSEYMLNGFQVKTIRPTPPINAFQVFLYFDDSNIPDATGNGSPKIDLDGCTVPCHTWTNFNYGNVNTINTFFFGSEERTFLNEPAICLALAVDDEDSTTVDVPVIIDVVDNDLGTNVAPTSVSTTGLLQPTNGTTSVNPITGEITYQPNPGFVGMDVFEYEICDDNEVTCSIATVTVTVKMPATETDCTDGFDNDGDGLIDCADPDCEGSVDCENPIIGVAKSNVATINNGNGTYTVSFLFTLENFGNVDLSDLTVFDDIVGQFSGMNPTNFTAQNGTLTANTAWNGTATSNILAANQTLAEGASGTVSVSFEVMPGATQIADNEAAAEGTSPEGEVTTDTSTEGLDPDGDDDDDNPDEAIPTTVEFEESPVIGVAKNNASTINNGDGTYQVSFDFVIENFGDVNLSNLTLFDDIIGQFAGMNPTNFTAQNGTLTANTNWDGTAASNILTNGQILNVGQTGTISISFTAIPNAVISVNNTAISEGTTPAGMTVNDASTAGIDADGTDDDDTPDENDPTVVDFIENALIGVAKNNLATTNNGNGTYSVSFDFVIENFGDVNLSNLTLFDDIFGQFTGMNPTNFVATSGSLTANAGWNGTATSNILIPGQNLNISQTGTVSISFIITPGTVTSAMNTATSGGTTPAGTMITDISTSGIDPDGTDGDDNPDEMVPTTIPFTENPSFFVEKSDPIFTPLGNDVYMVVYEFTLENTGDIVLNNLEITDNILSQFTGTNPTNFTTIDGSLIGNNSWAGNATSNVLQNGQNLVVGATGTVSISFNATLNGSFTLNNTVNVSTTTPSETTIMETAVNVYEFTPSFCPALALSLADNMICGNNETAIALTAAPNAGEIGIYYTINNQLDSTELYLAGHSGATLITTVVGNSSNINTTLPSGTLINNGTAAVTYYIYAILNDGNSNISPACNVVAVNEITVNPSPNVTATAGGTYCESENIQLFITGLKFGETVQWTGPNGFNSTQQNPTVANATVANDGLYSAVVTNDFGCTFTTNQLDIQVNEMPTPATVFNDSPVCANGANDVVLTANTAAAGTINWFNQNNILIGTGANLTLNNVTITDAGIYYAIIDNGLCPSSPSATTEVIVNEIPTGQTAIAGVDRVVCNAQTTVNLSANSPAIGTGMWTQNATNPIGATIANPNDPNTLVTNLSVGTYIFSWSLSNGACENNSTDEMMVTVQPAFATPTIVGDADICEQGILTLTASIAPLGTNYVWEGPNGFSATTQTITIDPILLNNAGDYRLKLTNADGCESSFSTPTNVVVFPKPATPILFGNEICSGENMTLQTGSTGDLYEWFSPASATTPAVTTTVNTVTISNTNPNYQAGNWTVKITDSNSCETDLSAPLNITIKPTPTAPTASYNNPVCTGGNLQLMASTVSDASYSWTGPNGYTSLQQNPIIPSVTSSFIGNYEVIALIDGCTSTATTLAVLVGENPVINPVANGGNCGGNIELFANASGGTGLLTYSWTGPNNFASFAINSVITNPTTDNEGAYTLFVFDENGCNATGTTIVNLGTGATPQPQISANPPVCVGENLVLSTNQYNGQTVAYEWTGPNGTSTTNGDYPNAATLLIENVTAANAGNYSVFVTVDGCGSNTSANQLVIINELPKATATTNFIGNCVNGQIDVTLMANPAAGTAPYTFNWNGPNGFNSNAQNPVIDNATEANSGTYTVMVADENGCQAAISTLDLNFANQPATPLIASPQMACFGEKVELTVTNPDPSVTYSWTFNGTPMPNNNLPTLVINPASSTDSGTYQVTATKADCTALSATVNLTVSSTLEMTVADQNFGCTDGATNETIAANVTGGIPPYTYVWTGPNGFISTQATPTIVNANATNSGTYNVVVTDDNGCTSGVISAVMTFENALVQPVFTPVGNTCAGENIVLQIQQYNGVNVNYSWSFNGNSITNNSNVLIINNAISANNGIYEVSVNADGCSTPANASFDLTVNEAIAATIANQNLTCVNNNTNLTLSANITAGTAPFSYQWSGPNGFTSNAESPVISNVSAANAGTYQVIITDDNDCQSTAITAVAQITIAPDAPNLTYTGNVCEGESVVLSAQNYVGSNVVYNWTKDGIAIANNSNTLNLNPATNPQSGNYAVSVTVDGCTATPSNLVNVEIFTKPTITIAPVEPRNCTNGTQSITLNATPANGSGIYTYAWSGPNGFIAAVQDPILSNINQNMAGTYTVQIFDSNGCQGDAISIAIGITDAPNEPQIMATNPVACAGETVALSVTPIVGANVSYSWLFNGNQLTNTANSLTINNVTTESTGDYQVMATVDGCATLSEAFTQTVFAKPDLTIFSVNDLTCANGSTDILIQTEVSTGIAPFMFSWTGPNGFVSAEQNPIIPNATSANAGNYQVVFTDTNGCVSTTKSVTINVTDGIQQPMITTSNAAVCEGEPLTLSVAPYVGANVNYAWAKNNIPIQNDGNELSFTAISAANNGNYTVTVTVNGCSNIANAFNVQISEKPEVTATTLDGTTFDCANGTQDLQLMATVTGGISPFTFSWTGPNGFASALQNPTVADYTAMNTGTYQIAVFDANNCGSNLAAVEIAISNGIDQPQITANTATGNPNPCEGENFTLNIDPYAGADVTYEWRFNGSSIGTNANQLIVENATIANTGNYEVLVTVDGCSATAAPFAIAIFGQPMIEIADLPDLTCSDGLQNFTIDATVTNGSGNYTYAWTGPVGFQAATQDLNFQNATADINGTYTLMVTDATGCGSESASVQISVQNGINEPIISATGPVCAGGEVTLEVTEYQGQNVNYVWTLNGNTLPITGHQLPIQNAMLDDAGEYQVTVSVNNCSATSDIFALTIFGEPTALLAPIDEIACAAGTEDVTFDLTVSGGIPPYQYAWSGPNGFSSTIATPTLSNVSILQSGTYTVTVTDENNCGSNAASVEMVIADGIDQPVINYNGPVCQGESITLAVQPYSGASVNYAWFKDSIPLAATTNQLTFNPISITNIGEYFVRVQVDNCISYSNTVQVEVFAKPTVEIADIPTVFCVDGTLDVELDATVTNGTPPYTYLWEGPGYFAVTEDALLTGVTSPNTGTYTLQVVDANGCMADLAAINVNFTDQIPQPVISANSPICAGESLELSVPDYTGLMVEYVWTLEGQPVGGNSPTLFISNANTTNAGNYQVEVIADECSSLSAAQQVVIFENPSVSVVGNPSSYCTSGQDSLVINSTVTGGIAPFTYEWTGPNGFFSVNANPVLENINDDMDGSYTVFVTDANGCQSNGFTIEIDIEEGIAEPVITSTGPACLSESITLSVPNYVGTDVSYIWNTPNNITNNISGLNSNQIIISPLTMAHAGNYQVVVIVDGCYSIAGTYDLMIFDQPTANPLVIASGTICEGGDLDFLANATGNGTLTYAWSGPNGFTSNVPNPTINNVNDSNNGQYLVVATNQQGCSTTATVTVNNVILPAPPTPTLTTNAPICEGEDLILSTSADGEMFAWVGLLGDSPVTLQLPGLMTAEGTTTLSSTYEAYVSGEWSVRVKNSNGCWSAISAPVAVEINEIPPAIATNGGAICVGGEAQLFANNIQNASYEWYIAGENTIISTQANPVIGNVNEDSVFELFITLNGCSSQAAFTTVTVSTAPVAQPEAAYFLNSDCSPSDLQLFANVATAGDFEFNWTGPDGFTSNLENPIIPNADETANGIYELTITNGNDCSETYGTNLVSIIPNQVAQPIITANNVACAGETLILTTTQYAGSDIDYVWLQGSTIVASSNNNQLIINEVSIANEGEYSVMVQVGGCVLTSNVINVSLLQQPIATPTYVLGGGTCEGGTIQLYANASNISGNATYQWNGPNGFTSNAPEPFIAVTDVLNNGTYTVVVATANGCSTTQSITIAEIGTIPTTPIASSNSPVCEGGDIILSVPQPAPGSPIYVWYNGLGEVIGNGQVLTMMQGAANAVSPYSVKLVQNGCESASSTPIAVTTNALATPTLSANDDIICEDQQLVLNATAAASNNATYSWFLNDILQGTTTNPTFIVNSATNDNTGIYTVQINVTGCESGTSNAVSVLVFSANAIPITDNSTNTVSPACNGSAVTLTTPFIEGANYTWVGPNDYTSTNFSPVLTNISIEDAGQYYVIVEVPGCATAVSATTTVFVQQPLPIAMIANDGPYCAGDSATLSILNPISLSATDTVSYEWFDAETMVSIGTTDTTLIGIADLNENQTGEYYVIMTLNGCSAEASEPTLVEVAALPQNGVADAGEDTELCSSLETELNAILPTGAVGIWTSPTGATIANPSAANAAITDLQVGENVFIWTLSQGGCLDYATDTVIYNVALIPSDLAYAGTDENLCGRSVINLNATTPSQAMGTWTQPDAQTNAGIFIVEPNNPVSAIENLTPGAYTFYWSLTEGGCENFSSDTVLINIMDGPTNNAYIAKDEFYACGEEDFTLTAETPSEGTGFWTSNTDALIVNPTNATTLVADLSVGENWFYWSLSAPDCPNYSVDSALIVVQDAVQGVEDLYTIAFNESLETFNVLDNDIFGNVTNYSFEILTRPTHGQLIPLNEEGTFDYIPNTNFFGFDTMQYVICNLDCPNACDTVTVSFLVGGTTAADDCFAPNLITPNGDGMNDALMFPCLAGGNFPDNNIMIFNRWGDKVYETKPYNNDWMGTYRGQPLPAGSYYYILMLEVGEAPLTGFFTVVR